MERTIKTRVKDGAEPVETKLSLDFSGCSREELEELASKTVIITWQGDHRKAGSIPTEDTVDVKAEIDAPRAKRGPVDVAALLAKMSPEERAAVLAKYA